jgi:hypothetical protein
LSADGAAWLREACDGVRAGSADVRALFPAASRRVGRGPLVIQRGATVDGVPLDAWRVDDGARALILLALPREAAVAAARDLYFAGDARERCGALRALSLLDRACGDALPAVLDAVRVNQGEIFEAAVCDNAYASRWLPDLEFRKAVLKCAFVGLPIRRVVGLHERADAELCASLYDYVLEREAASRSVAPELWEVMAIAPPVGLVAKLVGYLAHPDPLHRDAAGRALRAIDDPRARPFLETPA